MVRQSIRCRHMDSYSCAVIKPPGWRNLSCRIYCRDDVVDSISFSEVPNKLPTVRSDMA